MVLNETRERIIKTVGQCQGSATFSARTAFAARNVLEEFLCRMRRRCLRIGVSGKLSTMIIRATGENLSPGFGVSRLEVVSIRHFRNSLRRQTREEFRRQDAKQGIAQAVDAFEMLEK